MAVRDIRNKLGTGTMVSADQMKEAVFTNGFDPFSLNLALCTRKAMGFLIVPPLKIGR